MIKKKFDELEQLDRIEYMLRKHKLNRDSFTIVGALAEFIWWVRFSIELLILGLVFYIAFGEEKVLLAIAYLLNLMWDIAIPVLVIIAVVGTIIFFVRDYNLKKRFGLR